MSQHSQIPSNPMVPPNQMVPINPMQLQMQMPPYMSTPFPVRPMPVPVQLPSSIPLAEFSQSSIVGKRRREDEAPGTGASEQSAPKRLAGTSQDVLFRIVVPSKQIGKVIGKEGCRIQKIREATRATIKIADAIARHEERVIIISSKENENQVTDAENALKQIATLILKEDESSLDSSRAAAGHVAANTIRLLIAGSQAGGLIGVSGQNIEKLRNSSGASISVLAPNQLPLCASAHESDRVVQGPFVCGIGSAIISSCALFEEGTPWTMHQNWLQLSGDIPAVMEALEEIGIQLRQNPPKQVISISPTYNYSAIRPPQPYVDPNSADYVTFEMMISEALVGGLIGRCGHNISRIRNESGAMIKVFGGKGEQKHRQIQFGGSHQQVALAKQRVDEYIYSQLIQQSGGQQSIGGGG